MLEEFEGLGKIVESLEEIGEIVRSIYGENVGNVSREFWKGLGRF